MKLYYAPNTISVAVAITLEESGAAYEAELVDVSKGQQHGAAYAVINSKGRVPALETEGTILTETGAILDYLAARDRTLLPADALQAAKARSVMYYLASTMHVNHAHKVRGARWANQESSWADMAAKVPETMTESAKYLENECIKGPFVLGQRFSIADAYTFTVCTSLKGDGVDPAQFPGITRLIDTMNTRDSVRAVKAKGILK